MRLQDEVPMKEGLKLLVLGCYKAPQSLQDEVPMKEGLKLILKFSV